MLSFRAVLLLSSCFRSSSNNRIIVHKPNALFWDVKFVFYCGGVFVTGKNSVLKQCTFHCCYMLIGIG